MNKIPCNEAGCDFVAKGETPDDSARKLVNHISHEHKKRYEDLTSRMSKEELEHSFKDQIVSNGVESQ